MKGDFTRSTFDPKKHYSGVRQQQGRVQLDADWNEQGDIETYLREVSLADLIGDCGAPQDPATSGFKVGLADSGKNLSLSKGRLYVDGILCELDADATFTTQFDGQDSVLTAGFKASNPAYPLLPTTVGPYFVYLDVWQRQVTALEDPHLRETALGGPDTATRTQTFWQVKLFPAPSGSNCLSPAPVDIAAPTGKLKAQTRKPQPSDTPCVVPASAGYTRLDNQLYRVEVHQGGAAGTATFKWSRENGSVVAEWLAPDDTNKKRLRVRGARRDEVLGFTEAKWVELTDDTREVQGESGTLVELEKVEGDVLTLKLDGPDWTDFPVHPKVRRWDHVKSDAADHAIKVPVSAATWVDMEGDVQVAFEPGPAGTFRAGDYWLIPARAFIGEFSGAIEWPDDGANPPLPLALPPHGVVHHYCKLGVVDFAVPAKTFSNVQDCRPLFPAATENLHFFHVGGDGQEALPGAALPCPLKVGVTNGQWPVSGARVEFKAGAGSGSLTMSPNAPAGVTRTGTDGVARCSWTLPPAPKDGKVSCLTVTATLLDVAGKPVSIPVVFHAGMRLNPVLSYVGGNGQEAAAKGALPQPLEVRVANDDHSPLAAAQVRFKVIEGKGRLDKDRPVPPATSDPGMPVDTTTTARASAVSTPATGTLPVVPTELVVPTDGTGLAFCFWSLGDDAADPRQLVEAVLLDASNNPVPGQAIHFNASFREQGKGAGVRVKAVKLLSNGSDLNNDTCVPISQFSAGFRVKCNEALADFFSIQLGSVATPAKPNVMAILYLPYPLAGDRLEWSTAENPLAEVVGYQPLLLAGQVTLEKMTDIVWKPWGSAPGKPSAQEIWLNKIFTNLILFNQKSSAFAPLGDRLLVQILLKGNFIWSKADSSRYLDGGVLGIAPGPSDPFLFGAPPTIALNLDGSGRRGSDFEMWFWLVAVYVFQCRVLAGTGTVAGSLQDATGKGVAAISVTLMGPSSVPPQKTDPSGIFSFPQVPPGTYTAQAQLPGVQPQKITVPASSSTSGTATPAAQPAGLAKGEAATPESTPETEAAKPSPAKRKPKTPKARPKPKPKK